MHQAPATPRNPRRLWLHRGAGLTASGLIPGISGMLGAAPAASARAGEAPAAVAWPVRPVRLIVPFGPGSTPDTFARLLAERLGAREGQPFVVENRAGAGGNIGTQAIAQAAPDGATIGVSITGPLVNNALLYPKLGYDPVKDLTPLSLAASQPNVLVVAPSLGVRDARAFLALLRREPGRFNYASVGAGTVSHLSMEMIKVLTGTDVVHVPYPSSPAAVTSVLAGDTQMASLAPAAVMAQIRAGQLVPIAVTSAQRFAALPEVPTFREIGVPEVVATAWIGVVGPGGLAAPLAQRISAAVVAALQEPALRSRLEAQYMDVIAGGPAVLRDFMVEEHARWARVIRAARITLD